MKRNLVYGLSLGMLVSLFVAFFTSNPANGLEPHQTLNLATASEPVVDPGLVVDKNSIALVANIFDGLTRPTLNGEIEPAIAESWEVSADSLTYTFYLRDSNWSDGSPLTAHDFVFSWKRVLNPETSSPGAGELYMIEGAEAYHQGLGAEEEVYVKALDDYTLEVKLTRPMPQFLELVGRLPELYPVPAEIVTDQMNWAVEANELFLNNGPFMLTEWNHQSDYTLTKNPYYWGEKGVKLESIKVQIVESIATANILYLNGDIDYLGMPFHTISPEMMDVHRETGDLKISDMAAFYNYAININEPHLANANIRKALAFAVDRQNLIDNITKAEQTPALRIIGPTASNLTQDISYFTDADFDTAREYLEQGLEELGLDGPSDLNISLSTNVSEEHSAVAQFIQAGWKEELGIESVIETTDFQVHLDNMRQMNYQLGRRGEGYEYTDISSFMEQYYSTTNGRNQTGWENKSYQQLLEMARTEKDDAKREALFLEAEAIIMDEMPIVPLYFYTNAYVVRDNIQYMEMDQIGIIQFKDVYIE